MNSFKIIKWRQRYADTVWEIGLPTDLFRNKTHLRTMISNFRKLVDAETYLIKDKECNVFSLLFVHPVFLDPRTLIGNLVQTGEKNVSKEKNIQDILFDIGSKLYQVHTHFEQVILRIPDKIQKTVPGSENNMFLGNSIYPNKLESKQFAAADFNELTYIIFSFKKHHILVTIEEDAIIQIDSIKPYEFIKDLKLRQALVKKSILTDQGYIQSKEKIIEINSLVNPINIDLKEKIIKEFTAYLSGNLFEFDLPYNFKFGTEFQQKVWNILKTIPYGSVLSYEEVAERLTKDRERARHYARAVGSACGRNPLAIIIPCHRVIGKDRSLTGFSGGLALKGALLD